MTGVPFDPDRLLGEVAWVRGLALQLCADAHAAEDAAQETLAAALARPPRDAGAVRGFLARTVHNFVRMQRRSAGRRRRREQAHAMPEPAPDAAELAQRAELHRHLVERVLQLPEPQRELVLRHYFDGDEVAALARRTGTTPDAVRAHLRRARDRLRTELRDDRDAGRAFALLLAATRPRRVSAAVAATAAVSLKAKFAAGAAVLAAAVGAMVAFGGPPPASLPAKPPPLAAAPQPQRTAADESAPLSRDPVGAAPGSAATDALRFRLEGLLPSVPWTAPAKSRIKGNRDGTWEETEGVHAVAADGTLAVPLPDWARTCDRFELRLDAEDERYLPLYARLGPDVLSAPQPIPLPVEPASILHGRVEDWRGEPVPAARVCAFELDGDLPHDPVRAQTNTAADGRYRLQVPSSGPLLVLAVGMVEASLSGHRMTMFDGAISDCNVPRDDLVPATARTVGTFGTVCEVATLRLPEPAWVTGTVADGDGRPVAGAGVGWFHHRADAFLWVEPLNLIVWRDGAAAIITHAETDAAGRFRLGTVPGRRGACALMRGKQREPLCDVIEVDPPAAVDFRLLPDLVLRVRRSGAPLAGVEVRVETMVGRLQRYVTDDGGELRLRRRRAEDVELTVHVPGALDQHLRVAADHGAAPVEVDLPPLDVVPVALEVTGDWHVRQVELTWRRTDAEVQPLAMGRFRYDSEPGPFRLQVPPGRYVLHVSAPARAERRDTFLVATEQEVVVGPRGAEVTVAVRHGGRVRVVALDAHGRAERHARCTVTGGSSRATFDAWNAGRAQESPNLAPGTYEVRVDLADRTLLRRTVEVSALDVVQVRTPP